MSRVEVSDRAAGRRADEDIWPGVERCAFGDPATLGRRVEGRPFSRSCVAQSYESDGRCVLCGERA